MRREAAVAAARSSGLVVLRNMFWLGVEPVLRVAIGIPLAGFVGRNLGLLGYGEFNLALSFAAMFAVVCNLGLTEVVARAVARSPDAAESLWSRTVATKSLLALVYVAVVLLAAFIAGYRSELLELVAVLAVFQAVMSLDNSTRGVFIGLQTTRQLAKVDIAKVVAEAGVTVIILGVGFGALGLAVSRVTVMVFVAVAGAVVLSTHAAIRLHLTDPRSGLRIVPEGSRFAAITAVQAVYGRVGLIIVDHVRGTVAVGLVSGALVFVERFLWFLPAMQNAMFPFFSRRHLLSDSEFGSAFGRALRYQALLAVGSGIAVSTLGPWALRAIFPPAFWPAAAVLMILGWACAPRMLGSLLSTVLMSRGRERDVASVSAIQCAAFVVAANVFVQRLGAEGYGWALLLAEGLAVALQLLFLARAGALRRRMLRSVTAPMTGGVVVLVVEAVLPFGNELVGALAVCALYVAMMVAVGAVSIDDLRYLRRLRNQETATAR